MSISDLSSSQTEEQAAKTNIPPACDGVIGQQGTFDAMFSDGSRDAA